MTTGRKGMMDRPYPRCSHRFLIYLFRFLMTSIPPPSEFPITSKCKNMRRVNNIYYSANLTELAQILYFKFSDKTRV